MSDDYTNDDPFQKASEADLVLMLKKRLSEWGARVWEEPTFNCRSGDRARTKEHRLDLFVQTPLDWEHRVLFPTLAIEAKRDSCIGNVRDAIRQISDARRGFAWRCPTIERDSKIIQDARVLYPVAAFLFVSWDTWNPPRHDDPGRDRYKDGVHALADRILWESGDATLYGGRWAGFKCNRLNTTIHLWKPS